MNIVQERLHTLSQTPKGLRNGVCDDVCSRSSASPTAILIAIRAEKVLPMCVPEVLPTSPLCAEGRPFARQEGRFVGEKANCQCLAKIEMRRRLGTCVCG